MLVTTEARLSALSRREGSDGVAVHSAVVVSKRRTPDGMSRSEPEAVVCVPTFRRPEMLRQTLQSLADQVTQIQFAVVVVDNDPVGMAGVPIADAFFASSLLSGLCVVEPQSGNCRACNRAFNEARARFGLARYILMIDDDEAADPEWLDRMVEASRTHNAEIVGGPVVPHFIDGAPRAFARHPVYWPAYDRSGFAPMIYGSGNFLIRREAFERLSHPEFDLRYNFLGGGDMDFFTRCRRAGFRFYWEQSARIVEYVPGSRVRTAWVIQRGLRIGAINYLVDRSGSRSAAGRVKLVAKNGVLLPLSVFRFLKLLIQGKPALVCAHPMIVAVGRLTACFGFEPEQYRIKPVESEP